MGHMGIELVHLREVPYQMSLKKKLCYFKRENVTQVCHRITRVGRQLDCEELGRAVEIYFELFLSAKGFDHVRYLYSRVCCLIGQMPNNLMELS